METQGVRGNETDNTYEDPQSVQLNAYENVQVRVNQSSARSQKHEQETASNGKKSPKKTIFLVVCLVMTIAGASATIILFAKVMNNEKPQNQLNTPSTNFNVTNLEEKVDIKLNEVESRLLSKITAIEKQLIANHLEEKVDIKLNEVESRLLSKITAIEKQLIANRIPPVESCAQTFKNGVYTLTSGGQVYCSNGWTVFQRRMDGSIPDFHNKTWEQYSQGFGNMNGEFWLGSRKLHNITRQGGCRLRADLQSFDKDTAYAEYSNFSVASETNLFRLTVGGYNGTAGDSLKYHNRMAFSTNDRDNDMSADNCATKFHYGGWWLNSCSRATPNGMYGETRPGDLATRWRTWKGDHPMKFIELGVRCD